MSRAHDSGLRAAAPTAVRSPEEETRRLQALVDQAASFDLAAVAGSSSGGGTVRGPDGRGVGFATRLELRRFRIGLAPIAAGGPVRATNTASELVGHLELDWRMIPWSLFARPDREPEPTTFDPSCSQRFAMQRGTFFLGSEGDGFESFGAGRTFPHWVAGRPRLTAAAVGTFTRGFGRLEGLEGNFTLCGELNAERGFEGHVMVRIVDPENRLRTDQPLPPSPSAPDPSPDVTYLTWVARKGQGDEWENYWSYTPEGEPRGVNIPVELKRVEADVTASGPRGLTVRNLQTGAVVGKEIGFGREVARRTERNGGERMPFQFEGVSEYELYDAAGTAVGAITANFLEGRSIQMELPGAAGQPALRFGYFGVIVGGKGCFSGVQGMIYGTAGSVFAPPPGEHVITNLYVARLYDPERRFRAAVTGGGA